MSTNPNETDENSWAAFSTLCINGFFVLRACNFALIIPHSLMFQNAYDAVGELSLKR